MKDSTTRTYKNTHEQNTLVHTAPSGHLLQGSFVDVEPNFRVRLLLVFKVSMSGLKGM